MDPGYLVVMARENREKLQVCWDAIGFTSADQEEALAAIEQDILHVYRAFIEEQKQEKLQLSNDLHESCAKIEQCRSRLDCSEISFEVSPDLPLLIQLQMIQNISNPLQERIKVQEALLKSRVDKLRVLVDQLGDSVDERFLEVGIQVGATWQDQVEDAISKLEKEKINKKEKSVKLRLAIRDLLSELNMSDGELTEIDKKVKDNVDVGFHKNDIETLESRNAELDQLKQARQAEIKRLARGITSLWATLEVSNQERKAFLGRHSGLGTDTVKACREELDRLESCKQARMKEFVLNARVAIAELWDQAYVLSEDKTRFTPYYEEDNFTSEILKQHEDFVSILKRRLEALEPLLKTIERREQILEEAAEFAASCQDPNRFKIPGRMLKEEKFRKSYNRTLPNLNRKLKTTLPEFENTHGKFSMDGEVSYLKALLVSQEEENQLINNEPAAFSTPRKSALNGHTTPGRSTPSRGAAATGGKFSSQTMRTPSSVAQKKTGRKSSRKKAVTGVKGPGLPRSSSFTTHTKMKKPSLRGNGQPTSRNILSQLN